MISRRAKSLALLALVGLAATSAACATAAVARVSSPMTTRDREVFDGAADYVGEPSLLGGDFARTAEEELDARVGRADFVGVIVVRAVRTDSDAGGRRTVRVVGDVEERLHGEAELRELSLATGDRDPGFDSIAGHERQLLERRFLVFLKWARGEGDDVVARFHLSPASDELRAGTRRRLRAIESTTATADAP